MRMARELVSGETRRPTTSSARPSPSRASGPALTHLTWIDGQPQRARQPRRGGVPPRSQSERRRDAARAARSPVRPAEPERPSPRRATTRRRCSRAPSATPAASPVFQLHVPLIERSVFAGALIAEYSIDALLRHFVPPDVTQRHTMAVVDDEGVELAGTVPPMPGPAREPRRHRPRRCRWRRPPTACCCAARAGARRSA